MRFAVCLLPLVAFVAVEAWQRRAGKMSLKDYCKQNAKDKFCETFNSVPEGVQKQIEAGTISFEVAGSDRYEKMRNMEAFDWAAKTEAISLEVFCKKGRGFPSHPSFYRLQHFCLEYDKLSQDEKDRLEGKLSAWKELKQNIIGSIPVHHKLTESDFDEWMAVRNRVFHAAEKIDSPDVAAFCRVTHDWELEGAKDFCESLWQRNEDGMKRIEDAYKQFLGMFRKNEL